MALNFPSSPSNNQIYFDATSGNRYKYNATANVWFFVANNDIQGSATDTQVIFDDGNSANGSPGLTFNKTANTLTANTINAFSMRVTGNLYIGSNTVTITNDSIMAQTIFIMDNGSPIAVPTGTVSNASYGVANAAFAHTNTTLTHSQAVYAAVNTVFGVANAAFGSANNVAPQVAPAYNTANAGYTLANAAYTATNSVFGVANAAFASANNVAPQVAPAFNTANAAFTQSNTDNVRLSAAYVVANAAFGLANTRLASSGGTISGDLVVTGNLTTSGVTTYANTQTLLIGDNILTLNADLPAAVAPSEDAGLEVKRGSSANVSLLWNEGVDKWTFTNDGTTYFQIASNTDVISVSTNTTASFGLTNTVYAAVNSAFGVINAAYTSSNADFTVSNAAFGKANAALANTNATVFNGSLIIGGGVNSFLNMLDRNVSVTGTSAFYRSNNITRLWDSVAGDVISYSNTGAVGIGSTTLSLSKLYVKGGVIAENGASAGAGVRNAGYNLWTDSAFGMELHYGYSANSQSSLWATAVYGRRSDTVALRFGAYSASEAAQGNFYEYMTINNNRKIGIGITTPTANLHVAGESSTVDSAPFGDFQNNGQLFISGVTNSAKRLAMGVDTASGTMISVIQSIEAGIAQRTLALNPSGGSISIGTTSPQAAFHVANLSQTLFTANVAFGPQMLMWNQRNDTTGPYYILQKSRGGTANVAIGDTLGSLLFRGYDTTGAVRNSSAIYGVVTSVTSSVVDADINIMTAGTTSSLIMGTNYNERMRIHTNGFVGIGITTPSYLLDVQNTSTDRDYYISEFYSAANATGTSITHLRLEKGNGYGGTVGGYINQGVSSGLVLSTINAGTVNNQMWITSAGLIGIGTAAPNASYRTNIDSSSLYGSLLLTAANNTNAPVLSMNRLRNSAANTSSNDIIGTIDFAAWSGINNGGARIRAVHDSSGVGASSLPTFLQFLVTPNTSVTLTEAMRIASGGNVGIGTAAPLAKLHVSDVTRGCALFIGYTDNNNYYQTNTNQLWTNLNASAEYMRLTSTGNLGIGNTAPNLKLEVAGNMSVDAFVENSANLTTSYTITTGRNAMTAGPVTLNTGVTITVPSGSTWTVV